MSMRCNWCRKGEGRNYTRDKQGKVYYYYCQKCLGQINIELTPEEKQKLIKKFLEFLRWYKVKGYQQYKSLDKEIEKWEKRLEDVDE